MGENRSAVEEEWKECGVHNAARMIKALDRVEICMLIAMQALIGRFIKMNGTPLSVLHYLSAIPPPSRPKTQRPI
jgi:hypothetical protein